MRVRRNWVIQFEMVLPGSGWNSHSICFYIYEKLCLSLSFSPFLLLSLHGFLWGKKCSDKKKRKNCTLFSFCFSFSAWISLEKNVQIKKRKIYNYRGVEKKVFQPWHYCYLGRVILCCVGLNHVSQNI